MTTGSLEVQWLGPHGATVEALIAGDDRWIAPGTRWQVLRMGPEACFQLEIHADDATPVASPQVARIDWFDAVEQMQVVDDAAFTYLLADLAPGAQRLLRCRFDPADDLLRASLAEAGQSLFWHPLHRGPRRLTVFVARADHPVGLLDYLGRDHALIEAMLAGALSGNVEQARWLRASLMRHLAIEEELLFPAYLQAQGNAGWVRGLCREHEHLRRALENVREPAARRRFLLLLDGHDEKEEQVVYPDILARLGDRAGALLTEIMVHAVAADLD